VRLQTNRQTERAFLRKRRNSGLGEFRFLQKNRNERFSACSDVEKPNGLDAKVLSEIFCLRKM